MKPSQLTRAAKALEVTDEEYFSLVVSVLTPLVPSAPYLKPLVGAIRARQVEVMVKEARFLVSQQYTTAREHFLGNQAALMILKYPFDESPFDPEATALRKFKGGEWKCRRVNQKIRALKRVRRVEKEYPYASQVSEMREFISSTIGPFNLERLQAKCDLSGGASIGVHGNATNLYQKWSSDWTVTLPALQYATNAMWSNFHAREIVLGLEKTKGVISHDRDLFLKLVSNKICVVDANKLGFVKKTVEVHRTIAVEPLLNSFLQKGVDLDLRASLRRAGIDLSDQSRNAYLAKRGSQTWDRFNPWVTIDLSNASGSICLELVKLLLPLEWFEYLNAIRSSGYYLDGTWHEYESFCSMGNGFCFPLESLIFAAFCHAAGCDDFAVYGDDIIVRQSQALYLIELLKWFGFSTNVDKTFVTGPFRESCGSDFFAGEDVRPAVFDEKLQGLPALFSVHNSTLRNSKTETLFEGLREALRLRVPSAMRFVGLSGQHPDSYFLVPQDVFMASPHSKWENRKRHRGPLRDAFSQGNSKLPNTSNWKWKALLASPVTDPDAVNPPAEVDWYAIMRGAKDSGPFRNRRDNLTPEEAESLRRPEMLHTLRYTTKRRVSWISAPSSDGSCSNALFNTLSHKPVVPWEGWANYDL